MADNTSDIILFVGAGFSKPAGVPTMPELVKIFDERITNKGEKHSKYYFAVKKLMAEADRGDVNYVPDLEKLMDILYRLAQGDKLEMSAWKEREELIAFSSDIKLEVMTELENLIKDKCVIEPTVNLNAYAPLDEIIKLAKPLDIFSVNYDDVVEVFCYKNKYSLEDGFALNWEPNRFETQTNINIRLYKLHGSVLWYKTDEGAFYKLLLKVPAEYHKLVTGEKLQQLIVYPIGGKPIHEAPLAYAMYKLRERLESVAQCIVIGYSMRDKHIQDIFVESLKRNDKLKILLVNPNPFKVKNQLASKVLKNAIIPVACKIEEILTERKVTLISNAIKAICKPTPYEVTQNPFTWTLAYFEALDYSNAISLMQTERFWRQSERRITVRGIEYPNILKGLLYARLVGKFTSDTKLERESYELTVKLLKELVKTDEREIVNISGNATEYVSKTIYAIEWVEKFLQGSFLEESKRVSDYWKNSLNQIQPEINKLKDPLYGEITNTVMNELKEIVEKHSIALLKYSAEDKLDIDGQKWLFE
jgi:gas vesicle protein